MLEYASAALGGVDPGATTIRVAGRDGTEADRADEVAALREL